MENVLTVIAGAFFMIHNNKMKKFCLYKFKSNKMCRIILHNITKIY